jgi:hypothetical protein
MESKKHSLTSYKLPTARNLLMHLALNSIARKFSYWEIRFSL